MVDDAEFHPLLLSYAEHLRGSLRLLESAEARVHGEHLLQTAHDLKGSGGAYGFQPITETGALLEESLLSGRPPGEVDENIAMLCLLLRRAIRGIEGL